MTEQELDPYVEWIVREASRPVRIDAAARARLFDAIRAEPRPRPGAWRWLAEPGALSISRLASLAAAAGLVGIGVLTGSLLSSRADPSLVGPPPVVAASAQRPAQNTVHVVKFVLVAPHASHVSVVGDFNQWNADATPMARTPTGGTWSVTVPLSAGRHVYSFVINGINGMQWVADPSAPLAPEDGFGVPNSVVLVGGSSS